MHDDDDDDEDEDEAEEEDEMVEPAPPRHPPPRQQRGGWGWCDINSMWPRTGRGLGRWGPVPQPNQLRDDPTLCDRVIRDLLLHERKATTGPSTTFATQRGGTRPCGFFVVIDKASFANWEETEKQSWMNHIQQESFRD
ncbi:hypothetical protein Pelo_16089 [Pelomyxa schiedti]|nr:hypothetical protein Pelo_16089 [Pelomyxa schiedti]